LASRVDGQEEDKAALKQEVKKQAEDMKQASLTFQSLQAQKAEKEDEVYIILRYNIAKNTRSDDHHLFFGDCFFKSGAWIKSGKRLGSREGGGRCGAGLYP
jgi:hypothetical protein